MTPLARYERKEWLTALPAPHSPAQALVDAICRYQWFGWLFVLVQHHSCCRIVINKYQTLASGVTSQRYHLRWHTPRSKRFASSWNVLEFRIQHMKSTVSRLIMMFQVNSCVSPRDARTPLHLAAALGNLPITQLLIWVSLDFFIPFKLFCFSQFILIFVLNGRNVYVGILF